MKKALLFGGLLLVQVFVFAAPLKPQTVATVYHHLAEVNKQWELNASSIFLDESLCFSNDVERIQFHLLQVEQLLRCADVSHLNANQVRNRFRMLAVLHEYAMEGNFPVNSFHAKRQPYFIDIYGTHCAVGYLVKMSGFGAISQDISKTQNYAYVKEIRSGKLIDWSARYGFSVDELALIQPGYSPSESYEQIQGGTNGEVNVIRNIYDPQFQTESVYIAGEFSTLNELPCLNIGKYVNNQLSCLGTGLEGKIVEISMEGSEIVVAGEFLNNGVIYPLARFDGTDWNFQAIPTRPNSKATAFLRSYPATNKIAINHPTEPGKQEIWQYQNSTWELVATVSGTVYVIHGFSYGGAFDEITFHTNPETVLETKNLIVYSSGQGSWQTIDGNVSDTVLKIYSEGQILYVGGSGSTLPNRSNVCLSRFLNGVSQPLILANQFDSGYGVIWDIMSYNPTEILLSGQFSQMNAMYSGRNIMRLNKASNFVNMMAVLNKTVYTMARSNSIFYFGGSFTSNSNNGNDLKHLVKLKSAVGLDELEELSFQVYPNPSEGLIHIDADFSIEKITVSDVLGKVWLLAGSGVHEIDGTGLPSGIYWVNVEDQNGNFRTMKWVKR